MAYKQHTTRQSFHWQSDLSDERRDELIVWVKSLNDKEAAMLTDLLTDVRDTAEADAAEEAAGPSI